MQGLYFRIFKNYYSRTPLMYADLDEKMTADCYKVLHEKGIKVKKENLPELGGGMETLSFIADLYAIYEILRNILKFITKQKYNNKKETFDIFLAFRGSYLTQYEYNRKLVELLDIALTLTNYLNNYYPFLNFNISLRCSLTKVSSRTILDIDYSRISDASLVRVKSYLSSLNLKKNTNLSMKVGHFFIRSESSSLEYINPGWSSGSKSKQKYHFY